eukprot:6197960-Pleurochrysis_carterae.AAC.1
MHVNGANSAERQGPHLCAGLITRNVVLPRAAAAMPGAWPEVLVLCLSRRRRRRAPRRRRHTAVARVRMLSIRESLIY